MKKFLLLALIIVTLLVGSKTTGFAGDISTTRDFESLGNGNTTLLSNSVNLNLSGYMSGSDYASYGSSSSSSGYAIAYVPAPTVSLVAVSPNGTYRIGNILNFKVKYDAAVTVDITNGRPYIPITLNTGGTVNAVYAGYSGYDNSHNFNYQIVNGNFDDDGIIVGTAITANGGILKSADGVDANLTLNNVASTTGVLIDAIAPWVSSVSSTNANEIYKLGDVIAITLSFSEAVTVTGTPTLALNSGGTASYISGSGTSVLTFNYTVGSGQSSSDLDYSNAYGSLHLSGGTIKDAVGNSSNLNLPTVGGASSLGGQKNIVIVMAPAVTTQAVSSINSTTATGNGNITSLGGTNPTTYGVCWNTTGTPTISDSKADKGAASATGAFTASMTGLTANTTYYVRAFATNAVGTSYGEQVSFTTNVLTPPTATTNAATSLTSAGATLNGSINANNASTSVTFEYGLDTSYGTTVTAVESPVTGKTAIAVSYTLTGLTPNTTYHYRVIGVNSEGTTNGGDMTFTTATPPTVTGISPTSGSTVGGTTVTITGTNLTAATAVKFGSANATSYTVNSATQIIATSPAGSAGAVDITVTTAGGTSATSSSDQFTYVAAPTVTTNVATSISSTGATLNGSINANGASTAVKFEYGLTTSYGKAVTAAQSPVAGVSSTAVSYALSGLIPNTTYHYRVVGVNAGGTTNGQDQTFTTGTTAPTESFYEQITLPFAPTDDVDMSSSTLAPSMYLASASISTSYPSKGYKVTLPKSGTITLSALSKEITTNNFAFLVSTSYDASSYKYMAVGNGTTAVLTPGTYYILLFTNNMYGKFKVNIAFAALPNITSISPTSGTTAGGTPVTITGTNFTDATAVKFGATNATSYTVDSDTQITAVSPAGSAGAVDVNVTTAGGTSAKSSADQFTYVAAPTATTNAATSITTTGATLNGSINANNASTTVTFEYGLDTSYGTTITAVESPVTGSSATSVSKAISGLAAGTTYHYRVTGINAGGTANGSDQSFTTPKQSQTITFNALPVKTYGDADFSPEATASSGLTVSCTSSDSNVATIVGGMIHIIGTGTCTIYADQSGNNVYLSAAQASQILTVTKASLTITADNKTKVYGETNPALTFQYSGWKNGETETVLDTKPTASTTVTNTTSVGTYTDVITVSGGLDNNYTFSYVPANMEVTKAALIVSADSKTKVYGDVNPALTFQYSGWKNSETETVLDTKPTASTTVTNTTSVGTYADVINVSGGSDNNYTFSYIPANIEVTKAALTVTADSKTKVYGDVNPALTFKYSGWKNGETETVLDTKPTASTSISASTPAGTYEHAITVSGGNDNNYDFTYISASFSVNKGKLVIWLDQKTKNYGDENPTLTYRYTGFMNGDDESDLDYIPYPSTSVARNTNAGTYSSSITMTGGLDNNYLLVNVPANFIVNKAPLTVKADDKTKAYGETNPELTVQYSGWVNGDDETVLDTKPIASTTVDQTTDVGTYEITVAGGKDYNYTFSYTPAKMQVTKATLIVTADNKTKVYGDTNPELTFQYSGWVNGENETVLDTKPIASTTVNETSGVGTYKILVSVGIDNNYDFLCFPGRFDVTGPRIAGDINGDGKITAPEIAGDANGNEIIDESEIAGDINGDGNITLPELIGDVNGNGKIDGSEVAGDANGNGKLDGNESMPTGINTKDRMSTLIAYSIGNTEIRLKGQVSGAAIATLYDLQGKVIVIKQLEAGDMNVIPTPYIKTGVYLLWVKDQTRIQTLKVPVTEK